MTNLRILKLLERVALSEDAALRELASLYNYRDDDSQQFTRWQMVCAISHGYRMGIERDPEQRERSVNVKTNVKTA